MCMESTKYVHSSNSQTNTRNVRHTSNTRSESSKQNQTRIKPKLTCHNNSLMPQSGSDGPWVWAGDGLASYLARNRALPKG